MAHRQSAHSPSRYAVSLLMRGSLFPSVDECGHVLQQAFVMSGNSNMMKFPQVVQDVIDDVAKRSGITNPKFHVESGSGAADGYTSTLYRANIEDQNGKVLSLMVKLSTSIMGDLMGMMYATEGYTYSYILPQLQEVAHLKDPLPWPNCWSVNVQGEGPFTIALGDLRPDGYAMADRTRPLDEAHCREALRQLARLHGASMALEHLKPDVFRTIRGRTQNIFEHPETRKVFTSMHNAFLAAPGMLTDMYPAGSEVNLKLENFFSRFAPLDFTLLMYVDREGGNSLVHGDCHLNNMLFQYEESGGVTGCRLYDFQTLRYGAPATDLALLLLGCTEKALRDSSWDSLVKGYHQELQSTMRTAGCKDPDTIYSWERCKDQLRRASLYGLYMTPLLLHALLADSEAVKEFRENMGHKEDSPNQDHASKAPPTISFEPSDIFKQRFGGVVQSLVEWGWLPSLSEAESWVNFL